MNKIEAFSGSGYELLNNITHEELDFICEVEAEYHFNELKKTPRLSESTDSKFFLMALLGHLQAEKFAVILLDEEEKVIAYEVLFSGTIDSAAVYPREVIKCALKYGASSIILSHNHPSSNTEPSPSDEMITEKIKDALSVFDITVKDHIIVGANNHCSLLHRGLL